MNTRNLKLPGFVVVAVIVVAGAAHSNGTRQLEDPSVRVDTAAEKAFPDAPHGVDPMVTGPTSALFKQRQFAALCANAVWPNIPLDCYPDR